MLADMRGYVNEAQICIEAAIAAGESVAAHGVVPSVDFERVMEQLRRASDVLDKVQFPEGKLLRFPQVVRV